MRETDYDLLAEQIRALAETDPWYVPLLANAAALLFDAMEDLNWAGFYLLRDGKLVLGPFQGKHACIHIPVGKGVCGTAAERKESVLVPDVHAFPGHIACDSRFRLPFRTGGPALLFGRPDRSDGSRQPLRRTVL